MKIYPPRLLDVEHELLILGIRKRAKLSREGVSYSDIHFRARHPDDKLRNAKNWGREYDICVHPRHLDYILFRFPNGRWIRLDRADQPDAAGRTPSEFEAHRRQLAQKARNDPDRDSQGIAIDQEMSQLGRRAAPPPLILNATDASAHPPPSTLTGAPSLPEAANDDDFDPLAQEIPCRRTANRF